MRGIFGDKTQMKNAIEAKIKTLAGMIDTGCSSVEALQYTQAILNLAHAKATLNACAHMDAPFIPEKPVIPPPRPTPGMEVG
jgi:hypothetical protein